jgi:hypothetical protein
MYVNLQSTFSTTFSTNRRLYHTETRMGRYSRFHTTAGDLGTVLRSRREWEGPRITGVYSYTRTHRFFYA